jgi:hypothetical protein
VVEELVVIEGMRVQVVEQLIFASAWNSRTESSSPVEVVAVVVTREPREPPVED